jgi:DNA-directed RNA polymerase subunit RPC12/RpoP
VDVIRCKACGDPLLAELTETSLKTISGERIVLRRTTDHVACPHCGAIESVQALREEAASRGELQPAEDETDPDNPDEVT